jgi:hypothetical protein
MGLFSGFLGTGRRLDRGPPGAEPVPYLNHLRPRWIDAVEAIPSLASAINVSAVSHGAGGGTRTRTGGNPPGDLKLLHHGGERVMGSRRELIACGSLQWAAGDRARGSHVRHQRCGTGP